MNDLVNYYRNSKETTYNTILCVIGAAIWLGIAYFFISSERDAVMAMLPLAMYLILFVLFFVVIAFLFRAKAMGNMILVSREQFPHIYQMVSEGAEKLRIPEPEAFIYNSNGLLNAFARQIFGRRYLLLTSAIVDATTDEQVRFIVGHELGHHAAGHLNFTGYFLRLPARIIPFLHKAYSRQCEYTSDKIGLAISKDVENSSKAIAMLGCGCHKLNGQLNLFAFEKQENQVPAVSGFVAEISSSHPRLTRRVIALKNTRIFD